LQNRQTQLHRTNCEERFGIYKGKSFQKSKNKKEKAEGRKIRKAVPKKGIRLEKIMRGRI
jgi:hypothetical protein